MHLLSQRKYIHYCIFGKSVYQNTRLLPIMCANISCSENWKTHLHTRTTHSRRHLRTHMRTHTFDDESSEIGNSHDAHAHIHPHTNTLTGAKARVEYWDGVRRWNFTKFFEKKYINLFVKWSCENFLLHSRKKIIFASGMKKMSSLGKKFYWKY